MCLTQFPLARDVLKVIQIDTKHLFSIPILRWELSNKKPITFWEGTFETPYENICIWEKNHWIYPNN